jgi:hypothetical protein
MLFTPIKPGPLINFGERTWDEPGPGGLYMNLDEFVFCISMPWLQETKSAFPWATGTGHEGPACPPACPP